MNDDISLMINNKKLNYRVGLIIENDGKVLIEFGKKCDFGVIPGGRVKIGEDTKESLKRELKEEMNIDIDINELKFETFMENFFVDEGYGVHELFIVYKITGHNFGIKDNQENRDGYGSVYRWINIESIDNVKILPVIIKEIINGKDIRNYINH